MTAVQLLTDAFLNAHPEDAARVLERLSADDVGGFLADCHPESAARLLQYMEPYTVAVGLSAIEPTQAGDIIIRMPMDLAVLVLRHMESAARNAALGALGEDAAQRLGRRLRYSEGSAGAWMDPFVLTLPADISAAEALERVKTSSQPVAHYLYVVDRKHALVGVITLRELLRAKGSDEIAGLMRRSVVKVSASRPVEDLVRNPYWREYRALPLIDDNGLFVGAVRYDVVRRLQDELVRRMETTGALDTLLSLGELYWIGLSGVLRGMAREPESNRGDR